MKLIADLHVHTVASGHAFSTIQEIAAQAKRLDSVFSAFRIMDHASLARRPSTTSERSALYRAILMAF